MRNLQVVEGLDYRDDGSLDVHSIFPTLQGEGPFAGSPSIFVRLAACNLQCPLCDTEYTIGRRRYSVVELVETVKQIQMGDGVFRKHKEAPLVVLTGGEPLRQYVFPFVDTLTRMGIRVQIETNGTLGYMRDNGYSPWSFQNLFIVCSPKTPKIKLNPCEWIPGHFFFKYVIDAEHADETDGLPSSVLGLGIAERPARPPITFSRRYVYLSPADHKDEEVNRRNLMAAAKMCMRFGYRLSIQMHKILGME